MQLIVFFPFEGIDSVHTSKNEKQISNPSSSRVKREHLWCFFTLQNDNFYNKRMMISWRYSFISDDMARRAALLCHRLCRCCSWRRCCRFYFYVDDVQIKSIGSRMFGLTMAQTGWKLPLSFRNSFTHTHTHPIVSFSLRYRRPLFN